MTRARDVADTQDNVGGAVPPFAAGKNKIINGDFNINQRAFTSTTTNATYGFDRWYLECSGGTVTYSAQTFTVGTAPVTGYESKNFARIVTSGQSASSDFAIFQQRIEDVRTFAGQTVTVSFWAKASSGTPSVAVDVRQNFGTGGSSSVFTAAGKTAITTSWARYSLTVTIPSISGKTIGTSDSFGVEFWTSGGSDYNTRTTSLGLQSATIDFWGVQLEAGSVATAFQTATGTLAGELAACQRYYWRDSAADSSSAYKYFATVVDDTTGTGAALGTYFLPVRMRTTPSFATSGNFMVYRGGITAATSITSDGASPNTVGLSANGLTSRSVGLGGNLRANNNNTAYLEFSAEL